MDAGAGAGSWTVSTCRSCEKGGCGFSIHGGGALIGLIDPSLMIGGVFGAMDVAVVHGSQGSKSDADHTVKGRLPKWWEKSRNARFGLLCTGCVIEEDDDEEEEEGNHVQSQLNIHSSSYNLSLAY